MSAARKRSKKKIVVGLSGGVDSSLAAALLKKEGHEVIGMTFRMWPKEECGTSIGRACCNLEAITRARAVAYDLGIPYYVVDLSAEFRREVIDYFCAEYIAGRTPNPCVACNEKIKFGKLLEKARSMGASSIATGHYARVCRSRGRFILKEGADKLKGQSYFLFSLSQEQLARSVFPLGDLNKARVRSLARKMRLRTFDAESSQDICFTQDADYAEYIKKRTGASAGHGDIVDSAGAVLGRHKGITYYTIGQRRGLGIAHGRPLYVAAIDAAGNRVIAGTKGDVMKRSIVADRMNWIAIDGIKGSMRVAARIRYNHKKAGAVVTNSGSGAVRVDFYEPQFAPTPGQAVVLYRGDIVLGGGWIKEIQN